MCNLKRGDTVGVRGPFGSHWPVKEAEGSDIVIVAGGVGLAPLRPAIYAILDNREKYGHVALLYGARSPRDLLFQPELEKWRGRFDIQVEVSVDAALGSWHGDVGVITTLIPRAVFEPQQAVALVCGPEVMMRFSQIELEKRGIPPERVYISMERSMECAIGLCGHCQYGPMFICKDGPVYRFDHIKDWFGRREI
jgi:NAD(P)H-flavin reductase